MRIMVGIGRQRLETVGLMDKKLIQLSARVGEGLSACALMLTTAESCTGGGVAQALTTVPGSSDWFERGFVTYSNQAKEEMLGVSAQLLQQYGAVSEQVVQAMAEGALRHSHAQISLAISGIAGPGGAVPGKPVGTVWLAWAALGQETHSCCQHFSGDREQIREKSVAASLRGVLEMLANRTVNGE